jgi:hypothetical protein
MIKKITGSAPQSSSAGGCPARGCTADSTAPRAINADNCASFAICAASMSRSSASTKILIACSDARRYSDPSPPLACTYANRKRWARQSGPLLVWTGYGTISTSVVTRDTTTTALSYHQPLVCVCVRCLPRSLADRVLNDLVPGATGRDPITRPPGRSR